MLTIVYLENAEIDIIKWDLCITKAANALPYAYSWYLDIVAPNWDALVYGDYEVVMPLTHKTKLWQSYIFQPAWSQQLGVFSTHPLSQLLVNEFLAAIPAKFRWINMYLNEKNQFAIANFEVKKRFNYVLSLKKNTNIYTVNTIKIRSETSKKQEKIQNSVCKNSYRPKRYVFFFGSI